MSEFRKLAKDVYAFLQPPLICYSSAGVVIGDGDVIVVDSLTNAAMTQSLLTEIRRVTNKPIRFLIRDYHGSGKILGGGQAKEYSRVRFPIQGTWTGGRDLTQSMIIGL